MQKIKTENPQYYDGIDIFKFVMAIFVVILHTHPFDGIHEGLNFITADVLGRTAVPFFFAASGFLLQKKIDFGNTETKGIIKSYICRILKLYLIWTAIYFPIIIYSKIICSERGIKYGIFATLRDFVFSGSYAHLWYLPATAVGVVLVLLLKKMLGTKKTGIILLLLFAAGLLAQSYFGLLPMIVEENGVIWNVLKLIKKMITTSRNGIFFGALFIYLGTVAADLEITWKPIWIRAGALISVVLLGCEIALLRRLHFICEEDMYIMLIPTAIFFLLVALQLKVKKSVGLLRKMSMNIYFVHMIFKFGYREWIGQADENGMALFLFTLSGTLITAFILSVLENNRMDRQKPSEEKSAEPEPGIL